MSPITIIPVGNLSMSDDFVKTGRNEKHNSHVELFKRFQKANQTTNITFTVAGHRSIVPAHTKNENPYAVKFSIPYNCECISYIQGSAKDPNFRCYHILASQMIWEKICTVGEI